MNELKAARLEMVSMEDHNISFPIMVNRHKWYVEINFYDRNDGFECLVTFTSPNGRRYGFYLTDVTTDVEVYSRNGHLVAAQYPTDIIPLWMFERVEFLRSVLNEY